jgi:uncharacterized membrane protein
MQVTRPKLDRQIWGGGNGFIALTSMCLALYIGAALKHFQLGYDFILPAIGLVFVCGTVCLRFWRTNEHDSIADVGRASAKSRFPFVALLLFLIFLPEFWFGNPSIARVGLIALAATGLFCLLSALVNSTVAERFLSEADENANMVVRIIVVAHTIVFTGLLILRHYNFGAALGEDTGYYNQIFWNTLQGDFFRGSLTQDRYNEPPVDNEFALHNSPILLLILPIYWMFPSVYTLLVLKGMAISASAYPLYLIAKDKLGGANGLIVVLAYLFSRNVLSQSINAFHSIDFIALFLIPSFLFFQKGRLGWFLVFLLLSLSVREEVALTVWLFGFYALILRRPARWVIAPVFLSVLWWYGSSEFVLVRSQIQMEGLEEFFSRFGKGRNEILATVVREPEKLMSLLLTESIWKYFYEMIKPAALLPLVSVAGLFALPTMTMNSLIGAFWPSMINIANHYSFIATVCLFVGFCEAVAGVSGWCKYFNVSRRLFCLGIVCLAVPELVFGVKDTIAYGSGKRGSLVQDFGPKPYDSTLRTIVDRIGPTASVAAPSILLPELSYRKTAYYSQALWRYYNVRADYLVFDMDSQRVGALGCDKERYSSLIAEISQSNKYKLVFQQDGFEIYKRSLSYNSDDISKKYTCQIPLKTKN